MKPRRGASGLVVLALFILILGWALSCPAAPESNPSPDSGQALELLDRGEFAAAAGRFDQARELWNQALRARPDWPVVKARLAGLEERRRLFPIEQAVNQRRGQARLDCVEATSAFNAGDYARAASLLQGAAQVLTEDQEVRQRLEQAQAMAREMGQGSLRVECAQPATVKLDGRTLGPAPQLVPALTAGRHLVEVEAYGGSEVRDIVIQPRTATSLRLTVQGGRLLVKSRPPAQIILDGQDKGRTPLEMINLPLGVHNLELRAPGYPTLRRQVILHQRPGLELDLEMPAP